MARRIYIYQNKYTWLIVLVVIALIFFLWYYFKNNKGSRQGEKCPDGRNIPPNGDCGTNAVIVGSTDTAIVVPDPNGCIAVSKYITNSFPLTLGMKGNLVKTLQENLNKYFNTGLKADGYFGCKTLDAIVKNLGTQTVDIQLYSNSAAWTLANPNVVQSPNITG